ncbi:uncharacterized protein LOC1272081 isoform X2 [Anopheles gambiae]|uniref:uncharacterized protein LOC1272081 isoform X2 n=1 Tax=Anopheles gambiae TaxID=7165 RepID=UPI002AC8CBF1|nr:uncharacterized protein LOC1272081 isoform X2 [Anopheles gambiae]
MWFSFNVPIPLLSMPLQDAQKWLTVVLTVSIVTVATLPATPTTTPEPEPDPSPQYAGTERSMVESVGAVRKCSETSTLLYVETVVVLKDDLTSLINGTIEISIGKPVTIECVRIVAKTEHDRSALQGYRFVSPTVIEVSVAELPPSQSTALEYAVYVYGSIGRKKKTSGIAH